MWDSEKPIGNQAVNLRSSPLFKKIHASKFSTLYYGTTTLKQFSHRFADSATSWLRIGRRVFLKVFEDFCFLPLLLIKSVEDGLKRSAQQSVKVNRKNTESKKIFVFISIVVPRNMLHGDAFTRTLEIPQCACVLQTNYCWKVLNAHFQTRRYFLDNKQSHNVNSSLVNCFV